MGIDTSLYRVRIGMFNNSRPFVLKINSGAKFLACDYYFTTNFFYILLIIISIILSGDVEVNPGPNIKI